MISKAVTTKINSKRVVGLRHWIQKSLSFLLILGAANVHAWQGSVFWKVEKPDLPANYVIGTMHIASPGVMSWLPRIKKSLCASRVLYTELRFSEMQTSMTALENLSRMMNTKGTPWLHRFSAADKNLLYSFFSNHLQATGQLPVNVKRSQDLNAILEPTITAMQPWMVALMLTMPNGNDGSALDAHIEQEALSCGVTARSIETLEEQLSLFTTLPWNDQIDMVKSSLRQLREDPKMLTRMEQDYTQGALERLERDNNQMVVQETNPRLKRLAYEAIDQRNDRMYQRTRKDMQKGGVFIAVGALHLVGDSGLLTRLANDGWHVTPIMP